MAERRPVKRSEILFGTARSGYQRSVSDVPTPSAQVPTSGNNQSATASSGAPVAIPREEGRDTASPSPTSPPLVLSPVTTPAEDSLSRDGHPGTPSGAATTPATPGNAPGPRSGRCVIEADAAAKIFESGDGISDLDLQVNEGTILGLIGPSGSGKTTTVKMFTGGIIPSAGSVSVFGKDPTTFSAYDRSRIGYMPQRSVLYPNLSVDENLRFLSSLYGRQERSRLQEVLEFVELASHTDKRADEISGGMQRRLSLAGALVHSPDLLFLDEPTAGIDPVLRRKFWDRFTELKERGRTLLVTTQYVGEAAYCDYIGVLADGRLLTIETPDGLRRAAYGGDLIDVEFAARPHESDVRALEQALGATHTSATSPVSVRYVVPEAATAIPLLGTWSSDKGIDIEAAEQHVPPFDDVFVELVERSRPDEGRDERRGGVAS